MIEKKANYYAVIDTYVLVSALLKNDSIPGKILYETLLGDITPLLCDDIIDEYREVLARPKFKFNQSLVDTVIEGIIDRGIFLDAIPVEEIIPDSKDIVFYEVTMEGQSQFNDAYLVTGNLKHFPTNPYVVSPKEMMEIIHKIRMSRTYFNTPKTLPAYFQ